MLVVITGRKALIGALQSACDACSHTGLTPRTVVALEHASGLRSAAAHAAFVVLDLATCGQDPALQGQLQEWRKAHPHGHLVVVLGMPDKLAEGMLLFHLGRFSEYPPMRPADAVQVAGWTELLMEHPLAVAMNMMRETVCRAVGYPETVPQNFPEILQLLRLAPHCTLVNEVAEEVVSGVMAASTRRNTLTNKLRAAEQGTTADFITVFRLLLYVYLKQLNVAYPGSWKPRTIAAALHVTPRQVQRQLKGRTGLSLTDAERLRVEDVLEIVKVMVLDARGRSLRDLLAPYRGEA